MKRMTPSAITGTREQIIHVARDLIQTRSYLGFSFQDIADQVGLRKASLYHHFPSKESLGVEVLRESTQAFKDWTTKTPAAPEQKLQGYFLMFRNALHAGQGVCPAGALAPGWDCINDDLRDAVRELRNTQILWLTGVLGAVGSKKQPRPVDQVAAYVFAVCQGALISARMTGNVADFDDTIAQLKDSLLNK
jgi:TetR/AcrR family transcriptional repressor of nem operon